MFANEGIRTYFNDDLYFKTPSGMYFDFIETPNLYILPFLDDSFLDTIDFSKVYNFAAQRIVLDADLFFPRFMRFSIERIKRSSECITGADLSGIGRLSSLPTSQRKHNTTVRIHNPHTYFGSGVASDTIEFETSIPFGFRYVLTFLDLATKYLAAYFMRTHTNAEVRHCFNQYMADHARFMKKGHVELWFMDNGGEFGKPHFFETTSTDQWCAEYWMRRRFIVPWNPQENPAESSNRILLRPVRHCIAAANCSPRLWPFAVHQAVIAHNALCTSSETAIHAHFASISPWEFPSQAYMARPCSPYLLVHGQLQNLS